MATYTTLTGDPAAGAVPPGEYNLLQDLAAQWERNSGYAYELNDGDLFNLANRNATTLADVGSYITDYMPSDWLQTRPWAGYGLSKDEYTSLATTFGSEYKKITGQDISADALAQAFKSGQKGAGGLLTGSEYVQRLQNDANIQKTYGWVKYGLDFNAFQQQKLQMQQAFGSDLTDAQAVTQLGYWHTNQGANESAHAQTPQGQQKERGGATQSVIR